MQAPKILWYDDQECSAGPTPFNDDEMKYIRADLVDGLVEALEKLAKLGNGDEYGNSVGNEIARAALSLLEESNGA
jgi:hypothetical protein